MIRHVVLDRDGVLNHEPDAGWVTRVEDWRWERGAVEALDQLAARRTRLSVVTNQSGIGRGLVDASDVARLHEWLAEVLGERGVDLVGIFVCPHAPEEGCPCWKPAPGLVRAAVAMSGVDASATALVGDDERDLRAADAAGVLPLLVATGKGASVADDVRTAMPSVAQFTDVAAALAGLALGAGGSPT